MSTKRGVATLALSLDSLVVDIFDLLRRRYGHDGEHQSAQVKRLLEATVIAAALYTFRTMVVVTDRDIREATYAASGIREDDLWYAEQLRLLERVVWKDGKRAWKKGLATVASLLSEANTEAATE